VEVDFSVKLAVNIMDVGLVNKRCLGIAKVDNSYLVHSVDYSVY